MTQLKLQLLGSPQLEWQNKPLKLGVKPLMLLSYLALEGETARRTLGALLWPEADNPLNNLSVARNTLTKAIHKDFFNQNPDTFGLVGEFDCDVARWRTGALEGNAAVWELWRGAFLSGMRLTDWEMGLGEELEDWLYQTRETLKSERRDFATRLARAALKLGHLAAALPYLEAAQGDSGDPLEDAARWWILALGAMGHSDQALGVYSKLAALLREELEVEPTFETKASLECARGQGEAACLLRLQNELGVTNGGETSAPDSTPFVGRKTELEQLHTLLNPQANKVRMAVLQGEPGAGKTRLANELIQHLERSSLHLSGTCTPSGMPLAPFDAAARTLVRQRPEVLAALPADWSDALARFLPDLLTAKTPPQGHELERRGLFSALKVLLEEENRPTLFLLDDLQWADTTTVEFVQHWIAQPPKCGLSLIITQRNTEDPRADVSGLLGAIPRSDLGAIVALSGLSSGDILELAQQLGIQDVDAETLQHSSGGNPFYLLELLQHQGGGISQRVQDLVRSRLQNLSDPARQTLEALAILGDGAGLALIRKVSGRSLEESADSLEHLCGVGLLRQLEEGASYGHDIVREVVQSDTKTVRRSLLNLRAARARKAFPLRAAQHYFLSSEAWDDEGDTSDTDAARKSYLEAAAQLTLRGELEEGLRWYDRALEISENLKTRIQIGLQKVATYERYGRYREALAALEVADGLLLEVSDPILEAGALVAKARIIQQDGHYHPAVDLSQRALVLLGDRSSEASQTVRSEALVIMGWSHYLWKNLDTALELYQQSLELRKNLPDRSKMAGTLGSIGLILSKMGHEDAEKYLLECLSIREAMGDIAGVSKVLTNLGSYKESIYDYIGAKLYFDRALSIYKQAKNFQEMVHVLSNLSAIYLFLKDFTNSISFAKEALNISNEYGFSFTEDLLFNLSESLLSISNLDDANFYANQLKNQIEEKEMIDTPIWGDCLELLTQIQDKINLSHTSSA